jgi:hypothetical protein
MSDTAQLFMLAGVWTLGALAVAYFLPKWPTKIIVFALLVGIPFWELPFGYQNFQASCKAAKKVQVIEAISPQSGVCVDYPFDDAAKAALKSGFARVEARGKSGDVREYVAVPTADLPGGRKDRVTAGYCISSVLNIREPWRVWRHDHVVRRVSDEAVVARQSRYSWSGMWWQDAASPVLGRGGTCSGPLNQLFDAVRLGSDKQG